MTSSSLGNLLAIDEYNAVLDKDSCSNELYFDTAHLSIKNGCLSKAKWFKGSRDRGFRGTLTEKKE